MAALDGLWHVTRNGLFEPRKAPTERAQRADESYRLGRYFLDRRSESAFSKAVGYFEEAIAQDPDHAEAYAGLADAYVSIGGYGQISPQQTLTRVKVAAERAVQIDRNQAEPGLRWRMPRRFGVGLDDRRPTV